MLTDYLHYVIAISLLHGVLWYSIGRARSPSRCLHTELSSTTIVAAHYEVSGDDCVSRDSCSTHISNDVPKLRPLLTKGFMRYKQDSLVTVPYPEWSILMQPNRSSRCDIVVNPHVPRRRQFLCLAVAVVAADSTYNLLRIESNPEQDDDAPATPKLGKTPENSAVLNITGFFSNVASDVGRKKLSDKMLKLLPNLSSLEHYLLNLLRARGLEAGADIVVMVVNAGEMDLLANFACSCNAHNISMRNVMVFSGSDDVIPLIESFGAMGVYHAPSFADVSRNASYEYLDRIFIDMMWYKSFSVWLLLKLRYNVLFQDVDLVWYRDPVQYFRTASNLPAVGEDGSGGAVPEHNGLAALADQLKAVAQKGVQHLPLLRGSHSGAAPAVGHSVIQSVTRDSWGHSLNSLPEADAYLSDDGQRSLRYTPFFANSGFYYLVANPRTEYFAWTVLTAFDLLHITGSHQNIFTIRLIETLDIAGLRPKLLSLREFPSGVKFNHDKPCMQAVKDGHEHPFIFHM
jgi:hypothetical protein